MCHLLSVCIRSVNNTQIDNAEDVDVVMPMYNLTEHTDNYSKTWGSLWQFYRDVANDIAESLFKSKIKITGQW